MAEERIQRRLAAILAADVVGYSRLMERDEAGTLYAIRSRPVIAVGVGVAAPTFGLEDERKAFQRFQAIRRAERAYV